MFYHNEENRGPGHLLEGAARPQHVGRRSAPLAEGTWTPSRPTGGFQVRNGKPQASASLWRTGTPRARWRGREAEQLPWKSLAAPEAGGRRMTPGPGSPPLGPEPGKGETRVHRGVCSGAHGAFEGSEAGDSWGASEKP